MQLTTREAARIFAKLDIEAVESTHHVRGFVTYQGVRILPVHYSHGRKDMPGHVPKRFAKSLHLTPAEFSELKRCSMDKEVYFGLLRQKGLLPGTEPDSQSAA